MFQNPTTKIITDKVRPSYKYMVEVVQTITFQVLNNETIVTSLRGQLLNSDIL